MPEQKTKYYWAMVHLKKQNAKLLKDIKDIKTDYKKSDDETST